MTVPKKKEDRLGYYEKENAVYNKCCDDWVTHIEGVDIEDLLNFLCPKKVTCEDIKFISKEIKKEILG